jgi:uridine kinase
MSSDQPSIGPLIIGVAGGSGSGKTTICRQLAHRFGDAAFVLSSDNYYRSQSHLSPKERAELNFDHPDAIDFQLLGEHLAEIRKGNAVDVPQYDFTTHTRRQQQTNLLAPPILLVEGILLFVQDEVRQHFDLTIFVNATSETRYQRRLARDTEERGRTEASVEAQWRTTVAPMYERFVAPTQRLVQMVINTDNDVRQDIDVLTILSEGIRGSIEP